MKTLEIPIKICLLLKVGVDDNFTSEQDLNSHPWIVQLADVDKLKGAELKFRIEELLRIKFSVTSELRDLEAKRQHVQSEIALMNRRLEEAKMEAGKRRNELDRLQISLQQAKVAEKEAMERNTPRLARPKGIPPLHKFPEFDSYTPFKMKPKGNYLASCQMDTCFDYSLCPMFSSFQFYLMRYANQSLIQKGSVLDPQNNQEDYSIDLLDQILRRSQYYSTDRFKSCLFIQVIDDCRPKRIAELAAATESTSQGLNRVFWLTCKNVTVYRDVLQSDFYKFIGRAIVISETAFRDSYRPNFDLVISHWKKALPSGDIWPHLPTIVPAKRKYLATYLGKFRNVKRKLVFIDDPYK